MTANEPLNEPVYTCPTCQGAIRIDAAAGSQVACPLCQQVLTAPAVAPLAESLGGAEQFQFECPHCTAPFRATAEMMGQAVVCPVCHQPVKLPSPVVPGTLVAEAAERAATVKGLVFESESEPEPVAAQPATTVDDLLPPRFERELPAVSLKLPVVLDDGSSISVDLLDSPKKMIRSRGQVREIARIDSEERFRRRRIRTLIVFFLGLLVLILLCVFLLRQN